MSEGDRVENVLSTQYGLLLSRGGTGVAYYPQGISPLSIQLNTVSHFEIQATEYSISGSKSRDITKRFIAFQKRIRKWVQWRRDVLRYLKAPMAFLKRQTYKEGVWTSHWLASRGF